MTREEWYRKNCCPECGRVNGTGERCHERARCLDCGLEQCANMSGRCRACGGWLAGYYRGEHRRICGYKHCNNPAVRDWPRVGQICKECLEKKRAEQAAKAAIA